MPPRTLSRAAAVASLGAAVAALACSGAPAAPPAEQVLTPAYNQETGRLEQLTSDRDKDGRVDTWAYMNGAELERVEMDRDGDGTPDRIEQYETRPAGDGGAGSALERAVIARAEERSGPARLVVRRETYDGGVLQRVEEDTNGDGRMNRWETYRNGSLVRMDLDLQGKGFPDRRLTYGRRGIERIEHDPDGDGVFTPAPPVNGPR